MTNTQLHSGGTTTLFTLVKAKRWKEVIERCETAGSKNEKDIIARDSTSFNRTCLHLACARKPPLRVILNLLSPSNGGEESRVVVTKWKEDGLGYIPLHTACRYRASAEVITLLLESYGQGVTVKDKIGWTPLHVASYFNPKLSVIKALIQFDTMPSIDSTRLPTTATKTINYDSSPLLLACRTKAHSTVIRALLKNDPQAATQVTGTGQWTPLHLAIWHDAPISTIQALIRHKSELAFAKTTTGQTPLGLYWGSGCECIEGTISILLNPYGLVVPPPLLPPSPSDDSSSSSPVGSNKNKQQFRHCSDGMIHSWISFPQRIPGLLSFLLDTYPNNVKLRDQSGDLPLHRVIQNKSISNRDVISIIEIFPGAGRELNRDGRLPLNLAIEGGRFASRGDESGDNENDNDNAMMMDRLCHCFPDAVCRRDVKTKLYPFMLAGTLSNIDACFRLLIRAPEVIKYCSDSC